MSSVEPEESSLQRKDANHPSSATASEPDTDQGFGSSCQFTGNRKKSTLTCTLRQHQLNLDCGKIPTGGLRVQGLEQIIARERDRVGICRLKSLKRYMKF